MGCVCGYENFIILLLRSQDWGWRLWGRGLQVNINVCFSNHDHTQNFGNSWSLKSIRNLNCFVMERMIQNYIHEWRESFFVVGLFQKSAKYDKVVKIIIQDGVTLIYMKCWFQIFYGRRCSEAEGVDQGWSSKVNVIELLAAHCK